MTSFRSAHRFRAGVHGCHKCDRVPCDQHIGHLALMMYDFADELLAPYGKVMTWDIKAGLMGKREYPRDVSDRFFTWFTMINGAESATNVR